MAPGNKKKQERHLWPKGVSGNPSGRRKSELNKLLAKHIEGKEPGDNKTRQQRIIEGVAQLAMDGDLDAVKFIWDRVVGRPLIVDEQGEALAVQFMPALGQGARE